MYMYSNRKCKLFIYLFVVEHHIYSQSRPTKCIYLKNHLVNIKIVGHFIGQAMYRFKDFMKFTLLFIISELKGQCRAWYVNLQSSSNNNHIFVKSIQTLNSEKMTIIEGKFFFLVFNIQFLLLCSINITIIDIDNLCKLQHREQIWTQLPMHMRSNNIWFLGVNLGKSVDAQNTQSIPKPFIAMASETLFKQNLYTCKQCIALLQEKHVFWINLNLFYLSISNLNALYILFFRQ